jgi:hypothetical protein
VITSLKLVELAAKRCPIFPELRVVPHPCHLWCRGRTFHNLPRQDRQLADAVCSKAERVSAIILASACCNDNLTCSIAIFRLPGGWAIPIGILFVLSFPPLFGGEVICLLCGLVWGLWVGFGIVCAGTFLGEVSHSATKRSQVICSKHSYSIDGQLLPVQIYPPRLCCQA